MILKIIGKTIKDLVPFCLFHLLQMNSNLAPETKVEKLQYTIRNLLIEAHAQSEDSILEKKNQRVFKNTSIGKKDLKNLENIK